MCAIEITIPAGLAKAQFLQWNCPGADYSKIMKLSINLRDIKKYIQPNVCVAGFFKMLITP
jgi:hypothetical protein